MQHKVEATARYFEKGKVDSCNQIVFRNGQAIAKPFYDPKLQNRSLYSTKVVSTEKRSLSHQMHRVKASPHAGMRKKPLEPYSPNSQRSMLKHEEAPIPYKNTSNIVIGDRFNKDKRQFLTTAQNLLRAPRLEYCTNPGILSEKTKWKNNRAGVN